MAAVMADLENDCIKEKEAKTKENQAKKSTHNEKKKKGLEEERKTASKTCETNTKIMDENKQNCLTHVAKLSMKQLQEVLRYHFWDNWLQDQKLRKGNLIVIVHKLLERKRASGEVSKNDEELSDQPSVLSDDMNQVEESDDEDDDAQNIVIF